MSLKERLGLTTDPLYLMDGSAFIFRAFYAMQSMQRSDGFPTNALFIVSRILLKFLKDENPTYFGFILDGKGKNFRHEVYPEYKANRSATPEPLVQQLDPIKQVVDVLGLRLEVSDGCEADDCIASLAARFGKDRPVIILGADKDLKQCLRENVFMWDPGAKQEKLTTLDEFQTETGLSPMQWPDFQAIIGDSSDNIPGVPGIGPKTAAKIFAEYGSLEEIRDNVGNLAPSLQTKFADHLDAMFTYRELTTLVTDQCSALSLEHFRVRSLNGKAAADFLQEYELRTLLKEVREAAASAPQQQMPGESNNANLQLGLFDISQHGPAALPHADVRDVVALPDCAGKRLAVVPEGELCPPRVPEAAPTLLTLDAVPASSPHECALRVMLEGDQKEYRYVGPMAALAGYATAADMVVAPDVKALLGTRSGWRAVPPARWFDLGLAAYLLNPEERDYSWRRLSARAGELSVSPDNPAKLALALASEMTDRVSGSGMTELMRDLELPLTRVLADMEEAGIHIDHSAFTVFLAEVQKELDRLTQAIYAAAGGPFNIRSPQQLGELLFTKLGLNARGKTKGGQISTSQAVLEKLAGEHEIIDLILEYRKLEKLRSTYLEPMPRLADREGRIHTTFNQLATATGRLSSSNPNLQNIPVRGQFGPRMRACFTAAPGNKLVSADYSQIELRVLAHCSQDPTLLGAFRDDQDIHSRTASVLFDVAAEEVTPDQRRNAKTINFGLVYGMGPQKLAQVLKISLNDAKMFIERYFERLQRLKVFYEQVEADAREHGYVTTLIGRRRYVPEIQSGNSQLQSQARRQAINTVIQGSAADIIKIAMLRTAQDTELAAMRARLVLQVHDELLLEVPEAQAKDAAQRLADIMSGVRPGGQTLDVPLKVDYGVGNGWHEAH